MSQNSLKIPLGIQLKENQDGTIISFRWSPTLFLYHVGVGIALGLAVIALYFIALVSGLFLFFQLFYFLVHYYGLVLFIMAPSVAVLSILIGLPYLVGKTKIIIKDNDIWVYTNALWIKQERYIPIDSIQQIKRESIKQYITESIKIETISDKNSFILTGLVSGSPGFLFLINRLRAIIKKGQTSADA